MVAIAGLVGPVITMGFDLVIAGSYGIYLALLLAPWRRGPDQYSGAALNRATSLHGWLLAAAALLAVILAIDTLIAVDFGATGGCNAPRLIALASRGVIAAWSPDYCCRSLRRPRQGRTRSLRTRTLATTHRPTIARPRATL